MSAKIKQEFDRVIAFFEKYGPANRGTVMGIAKKAEDLFITGKLTGEEVAAIQLRLHELWPDS